MDRLAARRPGRRQRDDDDDDSDEDGNSDDATVVVHRGSRPRRSIPMSRRDQGRTKKKAKITAFTTAIDDDDGDDRTDGHITDLSAGFKGQAQNLIEATLRGKQSKVHRPPSRRPPSPLYTLSLPPAADPFSGLDLTSNPTFLLISSSRPS